MARLQPRFVCQQCGAAHPKWTGRCDGCAAWNSLIEELPREGPPSGLAKGGSIRDRRSGRALGFVGLTGPSVLPPRQRTGIEELQRLRRRIRRNLERHRQTPPISRVRKRSIRFAYAPSVSVFPTARCCSPQKVMSATSSPPSIGRTRRIWSSSIRSRPCTSIHWTAHRER